MWATLFTSAGVLVNGEVLKQHDSPFLSRRGGSPSRKEVRQPSVNSRTSSISDIFDDSLTAEELQSISYECTALSPPIPQRRFHMMCVLPWGLRSAMTLFATVGLHTNRGIAAGVGPAGFIWVRPYHLMHHYMEPKWSRRDDSGPYVLGGTLETRPLTAAAVESLTSFSALTEVVESRQTFFAMAKQLAERDSKRGGGDSSEFSSAGRFGLSVQSDLDRSGTDLSDPMSIAQSPNYHHHRTSPPTVERWGSSMELWSVSDLELAPPLALHGPIPPLRVGSKVLARRYGGGIDRATVLAAQYDASYTLRYDSDMGVDCGVLHQDCHLLSDAGAEPCSVRSYVTLTIPMRVIAEVLEAHGKGTFSVLIQGSHAPVQVQLPQIVAISPLLNGALYANPQHLAWFEELDPTRTGSVTWGEVRRLMSRCVEECGVPLSEQTFRRIQSQIFSKGKAPVRQPHLIGESGLALSFMEFEYAMLAVETLTS